MTINRRKAYPIVTTFALLATLGRSFIFPEFGVLFHAISLVSSIVFVPILLEGVLAIHHWFGRRFPSDIRLFTSNYRVLQRVVLQILTCMLIFLGLGLGIFLLIRDFLPPTLRTPMLSKTFLLTGFIANVMASAAVNLGLLGKEFFDNWKAELLRNERLQKERAEVQFDNLKNQFNPHFLFNSLTSLNSLIFENPQLASDFLQQLSKVYRYVLQANNELVSVETELTFIKRYVHLLETRFEAGLKVDFEISEEALEQKIVPVTLQILIENALKHNIASPQKPLHIRVFDSEGYLSVANNVQRKTIVEESNAQGLKRLTQLYSYLAERPLVVAEVNGTFCVKIPLLV
jgi:two-component system, LytTR family, sensor kinase